MAPLLMLVRAWWGKLDGTGMACSVRWVWVTCVWGGKRAGKLVRSPSDADGGTHGELALEVPLGAHGQPLPGPRAWECCERACLLCVPPSERACACYCCAQKLLRPPRSWPMSTSAAALTGGGAPSSPFANTERLRSAASPSAGSGGTLPSSVTPTSSHMRCAPLTAPPGTAPPGDQLRRAVQAELKMESRANWQGACLLCCLLCVPKNALTAAGSCAPRGQAGGWSTKNL
jgi:hypothetical protein